jgi:hypothetical protein
LSENNPIQQLDLPTRWEVLKERAKERGLEASEFVQPIDSAASHVDALLYRVRSNGIGAFEVVFGLSGSGKTTFVNTLGKFFGGVEIHEFPKERHLTELPQYIKSKYVPGPESTTRLFLISRRDNPSRQDIDEISQFFSDLVDFFRTPEGRVLILWTVTRANDADTIAAEAWQAGSDSVVSPETKGLFRFQGLDKVKYQGAADVAARSLSGDGLEGFGLDQNTINACLQDCDTISDFYGKLNAKAQIIRGQTWSVFKERIRPRLWIVVPANDPATIDSTVGSLTQGQRGRVDIDLLQEWVDDPNNTANYAVEWRKIRHKMAHLFRALDVRLFGMYPNATVAAVRAFGDQSIRDLLQTQSVAKKTARSTMRNTRLYKELLAELVGSPVVYGGRGNIKPDTHREYQRIQVAAEKRDSELNRALGALIVSCLIEDVPNSEVIVDQKSIKGIQLRPDVAVSIDGTDYVCIEPTWRSTGIAIDGELGRKQNTATPGHIKIYVMNKALEYVKALDLYD